MKKILVRDAPKAIADKEDFKAGDLHGLAWQAEASLYPIARRIESMAAEERETLLEAVKFSQESPADGPMATNPQSLDYLVSSYGVPIAWMTRDGKVHRTRLRHSDATAKHIDIAVGGLQNLAAKILLQRS